MKFKFRISKLTEHHASISSYVARDYTDYYEYTGQLVYSLVEMREFFATLLRAEPHEGWVEEDEVIISRGDTEKKKLPDDAVAFSPGGKSDAWQEIYIRRIMQAFNIPSEPADHTLIERHIKENSNE